MIIIGEKLNSSVPLTLDAIKRRDTEYILKLIKNQEAAGADYLDINTALTGADELSNMLWIIELAVKNSRCGIMPDSPDPQILKKALAAVDGRNIILNSVTALSAGDGALISAAKERGAALICLPIEGSVMSASKQQRIKTAGTIVKKLNAAGIGSEKIFVDILVEAASTGADALSSLGSIASLKNELGVKTVCGLSNVSFGLPDRIKINSVFLAMVMQSGIDAVIADITSEKLQDVIFASNVILGRDEYCIGYIERSRAKN